MNLTDWANLGTAAGSVLAGLSIFAGYHLYKKGKQDEFSSTTRKKLINIREKCHELNRLVTYELAHEVAETVIFSPSVTYQLTKLINDVRDNNIPDESLDEYVKHNFPSVITPVNSPLVSDIESIIRSAKSDIGELRFTFPGLYRVTYSVISVFSIIVAHHKRITRDDEIWEELLPNILKEEKNKSVEDIQHILHRVFLSFCHKKVTEHDQDDIDDLLSLLDLTLDAYLDKTNKELENVSLGERRAKLKPTSQTNRINEDLREAEKVLENVLSHDDIEMYRELIVKLEQRNSSKEDR